MDRLTAPGVKQDARPFVGTNFQAALKDLEGRMRNAAANLEFEEAARLRDEIKKMKLLDLEFANDVMDRGGGRGRQVGPEALAGRGCG